LFFVVSYLQGAGTDHYEGIKWEIKSSSVEKEDKEYPCCPGETYTSLKYNFDLKRI